MPLSPALQRVPALDGLRAIAVGSVVALHAGVGGFDGGGIGVDLFLVLSGYLITSLLLREADANGHVSIGQFYARRALRLYPALLTVVLTCLVVAFLVNDGDFIAGRGAFAAGAVAILYLSDIQTGWGWLPATGDLPLFHTWSLSIEEHFYLAWAPILTLMMRHGDARRIGRWLTLTLAFAVVWVVVVATALSADFGRLAYSPDTRGIGLVLGCLIATLQVVDDGRLKLHAAAPWVALVAFIGLTRVDGLHTAWAPVVMLVVDLVAAVMIVGAINGGSFQRFWSHRLLVAVGLRAYGIYLWHFPVFHFLTSDRLPQFSSLELGALKLVATAVVVEVSYRAVERPALRLRKRFTPRHERAAS